jgi:hypothetical protein
MAEIGGKYGKALLHVRALAIPVEQRADGERMSQVMDARSATIARAPQADFAGQAPKNRVNVLLHQSITSLRDEEMCTAARSEMTVAPFGVAAQRFAGRWMQGYEARFAAMPLAA